MKADAWLRSVRRNPLMWGVPLAVVAVTAGLFLFYQLVYAGRVAALEQRFADENATLAALVEQRSQLSDYLERVGTSRDGINALYLDHFQTAPERLTATLAEIERLAAAARINPPAFSYPQLEIEELQLQQMGINFGVEGTYEQLRSFINLLQLSDHFLILKAITLNRVADRGGSPRLSINFSVSTIFVTDELARRTRAARRLERASAARADRDALPASSVDPMAAEEEEGEGAAGAAATRDAEDESEAGELDAAPSRS